MKMQRIKKNEHAVSPVVGVMLMLVVTIIIAAVVSAFAGGLVAQKERAPQATLDCHITWDDGAMSGNAGPLFTMKHVGGDPINTKNVKLVTSWANETGVYNIQSTVAPTWGTTAETYTTAHSPGTSNYTLSSLNTHYTYYGDEQYYNSPYLVVPGSYPTETGYADNDTALWFGNYVFKAGDVIQANTDNTVSGSGSAQNQATPIIKYGTLLTRNSIVEVQLIDLKSGTTIYDKNVNVEV
ncbi:type IV pilin N-terminal domain-containing protein [Methanoregula sp.]|jgi:FlaG/FlaF family flagellin (archaellin)|uniref:type IV pilin N-terminal domain-containing protein n=1 Tax=Methanoregula sp. TaxID=2052170 RepID=UPI0035628382